jgi:hypothetical protein
MRKLWTVLLLAVLAAFSPAARAQCTTTIVSGTVTDPNGIPYAFGSVTISLVPAPPGTPLCNGVPFSSPIGPPTQLSSTGSFSLTVPANSAISPGGTQWLFAINESPGVAPPLGVGPVAFSVKITVTATGTQSVSAALTAAAPALIVPLSGSGGGATLQTNSVNNASQSLLNLVNSAAFNGLTATVTNTGSGIVQLGFSGTLGNAGLTNSSITINTIPCTLGGSCTVSSGSGITNLATTAPITGGPITTTGTIACPTCGVTGSPLSQFAATTSAQLAGVITNETGTGLLVFGTSPSLNLAGSAVFQLPAAASFVSTATLECGIDSTNDNLHCWNGTADLIELGIATAPTSGHVLGALVSSGSVTAQDLGPAAGGGSSFLQFTPAALTPGDYIGINGLGIAAELTPGFTPVSISAPGTTVLLSSYRGENLKASSTTGAQTFALPDGTTTGFTGNFYTNFCNHGTSGPLSITNNGGVYTFNAAASPYSLPEGYCASIANNSTSTGWGLNLSPGLLTAGANITLTQTQFGTTIASTGGSGGSLDTITGAANPASITATAAANAIKFAGISTSNLTSDYTFTNANSTNNNSSVSLIVTNTGTSTASIPLVVNQLTAGTDAVFGHGGSVSSAGALTGFTADYQFFTNGNFLIPAGGTVASNQGNLGIQGGLGGTGSLFLQGTGAGQTVEAIASSATSVGLSVKLAASPTADAVDILASNGITVLASFSNTGALTVPSCTGCGGGGAPSLDTVTGSAAQATGTETAAGHQYTFAGVETAALTYPFVFTNNSASNNTSGALIVNTTGAGNAQVPLVINEATAAGDLIDTYNGGTVTNGVLSGGTKEFTVGKTGNVALGTGETITNVAQINAPASTNVSFILSTGNEVSINKGLAVVGGLFTISASAGIATEYNGINTVNGGLYYEIYDTDVTSSVASIGSTSMLASSSGNNKFEFSGTIAQVNVGSGCTVPGSVGVNVIYTDQISGVAVTQSVAIDTGTVVPALTLPFSTSTVGSANVGSFDYHGFAKTGTAISYSTTYTNGTCTTTQAAYGITPILALK